MYGWDLLCGIAKNSIQKISRAYIQVVYFIKKWRFKISHIYELVSFFKHPLVWHIDAYFDKRTTLKHRLRVKQPIQVSFIYIYIIQIKICAEYRDMLPRPRLVCQEPGLRPIGRSPGVPDKSSRGLGSMSRYSAQILICFIAYIFSISLWVWLGTLQNCHHAQCPLPLFIVIRMRLLSAHQTIKSPSMPCWGAAGRNTHWHSCHRTGEISR